MSSAPFAADNDVVLLRVFHRLPKYGWLADMAWAVGDGRWIDHPGGWALYSSPRLESNRPAYYWETDLTGVDALDASRRG